MNTAPEAEHLGSFGQVDAVVRSVAETMQRMADVSPQTVVSAHARQVVVANGADEGKVEVELELRLGHLLLDSRVGMQHFVPGCSREHFQAMFKRMKSLVVDPERDRFEEGSMHPITSKHDWQTQYNYHHAGLRHRVSGNERTCIRKTTLSTHDLRLDAMLDVRVALAQEVTVENQTAPISPSLVRAKQCAVFHYGRMWEVVFSIVWASSDQKLVDKQPPRYEVEVELCGGSSARNSTMALDQLRALLILLCSATHVHP